MKIAALKAMMKRFLKIRKREFQVHYYGSLEVMGTSVPLFLHFEAPKPKRFIFFTRKCHALLSLNLLLHYNPYYCYQDYEIKEGELELDDNRKLLGDYHVKTGGVLCASE